MSEEQTSLSFQAEHDPDTEPELFEERFPPGIDEDTQREILKDLGIEEEESQEEGGEEDSVEKKLTPLEEKLQRLEEERDAIARQRDGILGDLQDMRRKHQQLQDTFQQEAAKLKEYVGMREEPTQPDETDMLKQQVYQMQQQQYQKNIIDFLEKAENYYAGVEQETKQKYEDYDQTIDQARGMLIENLRRQGLARDQAEKVFEIEKYRLVAQAASQGVNFPEWAYHQAKQLLGQQPAAPNQGTNAPKQGARKRRPTSLSQMGGSGGGQTGPASTLEKLAETDPDQFASIMADDNLRRKWMMKD